MKYKARLVAKDYFHKKVDYDEILSPFVRHTFIRVVLEMVASWDFHLEQMDVKTTLLYGALDEEIYGVTKRVYENQVRRSLCAD